MLLWLNAVSSPVGKKKKSIDLHCIQVKVEISECFRQIKKKYFVRVCTTKGGWDDCTPMNWPFNFKPASLEVTPQIVSVIKSPFPNPSVLAKTFFWGGQAFVSRVLSIQRPCSVADGPLCVHTWTDVQPFKLSPCPFCPSEHLTKKKKEGERTPSCQIALPYYNSWLQIEYSGLDTTAAKTLARHESSRWWSYHAMFICFYNLFLIYVVTGQVNGSHF